MKNSVLFFCFMCAGCASFILPHGTEAGAVQTARVPVLLYHHIQDLPDGASRSLKRWSLSPDLFTRHMGWISQQGFNVVTMAQWNDHLNHGSPLPVQPIIITFDDGWKDHYTVVLPILQKYHFSATFFIATDSVGHSAFVNWEQLKEMSAAGMDIQAHSLTHPHLNQISFEDAYHEIHDSKKTLESHLGKPVRVFAYPFGSYTAEIIDMVKKAGYESAAIVNGRNIGFLYRADRTYTISRIAIEGDTTVDDLAESVREMKENHVFY